MILEMPNNYQNQFKNILEGLLEFDQYLKNPNMPINFEKYLELSNELFENQLEQLIP